MARTVLGAVGAVIGGIYGGAQGAQLGWFIGSTVGGIVDPQVIKGPSLGDLPVQTAQDGMFLPFGYGKWITTGNILDRSEPRIVIQEEQQGKGGPVVESERLLMDYAIRICESIDGTASKVIGVTRVWENEKLVYDVTPGSTITRESAKWLEGVTFHLGDQTQLPDATLEAIHGAGNVPAYRGRCYAVFRNQDLTDKGKAIPQYRVEVVTAGSETPPASITADGGSDATSAMLPFANASSPYGGYSGTASEHWDASIGNPAPGLKGGYMRARIPSQAYIRFDAKPRLSSGNYYGHTLTFLSAGSGSPSGGGPVLRLSRRTASGWQYGYRTTTHGLPDTFVALGSIDTPDDDDWHRIEVFIRPGYRVDVDVDGARKISNWNVSAYANGDWIWWDKELAYSPLSYMDNVYASDQLPITVSPGVSDLASIILDLADRCGVPASRLDVSELTDEVRGYAVRNEYSAAGIMRPLQRAFFFDSYDADGKTWFPKRGGDVVLTLTEADLVDDPEFDDDTRNQEVEYPQTLHLMYDDPDNAQAPADQPSTRTSPDVRVRGSMTVEVPITFTADEAAQVADRLHKIAFTDLKGKVRIPIPASYARLTPSDCIVLDYEGRVRRLAIEKRVLSDEVLQLTCRHERQSNYTSNVTGYPSRPPLPPTPTYPGETDFVWMNLPVLDDAEDSLGWHCAVAGSEDGWAGARVDMSSDEGATYTPQVTITRGAVIGVLLAPLGDASPYVTDTQNELRIALVGPADVLESASRAQCLRGANAVAIVTADGTCEIVQFQDMAEESDNVWVGTTLLRGRKNTEAQAHAIGARAVLLTGAEFVPTAAALIGTDLWLRATSVGNSPDDSEEFVRTWAPAVSQTEWAPTYLRLTRSGSTLSATWSPRHRLGAARYPVASANFQGYRVTLTKGANSVSFDTTASSFSDYDTSSLGSAPIDVSVQGINRITGVGDAVQGSA